MGSSARLAQPDIFSDSAKNNFPKGANRLEWARQAAPGEANAALHRRLALAHYDDRLHKTQEVIALERELAFYLSQTPYVLLLSFPGINVVWAAEFAGEMGPIEHYANAKAIPGRAGLFPRRYQSDRVDAI